MSLPKDEKRGWLRFAIATGLFFVVVLVYWPTIHFNFVSLDDTLYVYENPHVLRGWTWAGFVWSWHAIDGANWNPALWWSHMLVQQFGGSGAGPAHGFNLFLHAINACLLFLLLTRVTQKIWPSAWIAAVLALHPTHVESVAWISERKDVLSGFFLLLTLHAYVSYAKKSEGERKWWYATTLILFLLGLMSKPMLVTLPALLFLLDFWPLQRKESKTHLITEKLPLFAVSCLIALITIWAQNAAQPVSRETFLLRQENAAFSVIRYIWKFFIPDQLAFFYPFPKAVAAWQWVAGLFACLGISFAAWKQRSKRPYVLVGWFWFLISISPVIGLIQVGGQAWADRYTYIPYIGLALLLAWAAVEITRKYLILTWPLVAAGCIVLIAWVPITRADLAHWRDSDTLYQQSLILNEDNYIALSNLAESETKDGQLDAAETKFRHVLSLLPESAKTYNSLGKVFALKGNLEEAKNYFDKAVTLEPDLAAAHYNLGNYFLKTGHPQEAIAELKTATRQNPEDILAQSTLSDVLIKSGHGAEALPAAQAVTSARPNDPHAHYNLGWALLSAHSPEQAAVEFGVAAQLAPDNAQCLNSLAWIYATSTQTNLLNGPEAVQLAEKACSLTHNESPDFLDTLAAAYAQAGRFADALRIVAQMQSIAERTHDATGLTAAQQRAEYYKARKPYRSDL